MRRYSYDDGDRYESATARCPKCRKHFRTLADEAGMHDCPHCGYGGHEDEPDEDQIDPHAKCACGCEVGAHENDRGRCTICDCEEVQV